MGRKTDFNDYKDFLSKVGCGTVDGVSVTHDGYPLSVKEEKFIDLFIANGDMKKSLRAAGMNMRSLAGKDYITDEINYRLGKLRTQAIADADEVMRYFTSVMRNEEKDQFGLDAPLSERTNAARELAKRIIDVQNVDTAAPEIKVTLNWEGVQK